ncbi:heterokaryon incompatibility protein-domain-containing protein [Xylaria arbuscula]|nr:heterokaryon incompatibility protein-domain-containing protein [Xylaria arbuscula]
MAFTYNPPKTIRLYFAWLLVPWLQTKALNTHLNYLRQIISTQTLTSKMELRRSQETSSFVSIRKSLSRSISTRALELRRRVSSSSNKQTSSLCICCNRIDLSQVSRALETRRYNSDGIILGELQDDPATTRNCPLCQILSQVCKETCSGSPLQLRAFYLLPHLSEQWQKGGNVTFEHRTSDIFVAAVPSKFSMAPGNSDRYIFDDMVSKRGFLMYHDDSKSENYILNPRLIAPHFDPSVVQDWLGICSSLHNSCRVPQRPQSALNLIDCRDRNALKVEEIPTDSAELEYVALSYVWGHSIDVSKVALDGSRLPQSLPAVIKDAIEVTLQLGYHYLWADKYCIDKHDKGKKHEQLMNMDSVYKNAALTIVAAAGTDESYGLPGVSRARPARQLTFKKDDGGYQLVLTLPLPHSSITKSKWATRGWTYQEAILSRRLLFFTDDQLYFECHSTSRSEGFNISFDNWLSGSAATHGNFIRPPLFSLKQLTPVSLRDQATRLSNFSTYVHCAEQYSKRTLTFDKDSLVAFSGIIRILESAPTFPVRHLWGIPFFHPDDDNLADDQLWKTYQSFQLPPFWKSPALKDLSEPSMPSPYLGTDYSAFLMLGLSWRHSPLGKPPCRRKDLPSWSWTGWEGSLAWPNLTKDSVIRSPTWANTVISLGSNNSESVPELYHKGTDTHLLSQSNKSLFIRTAVMSHKAFVLHGPSYVLALSTGHEVKLYPSKEDLDVLKVFKRIHSERYKIIELATIDDNTYMMLIKKYRNSYYRIGTMVVEHDALSTHRLDTSSLYSSKIKTYKLR